MTKIRNILFFIPTFYGIVPKKVEVCLHTSCLIPKVLLQNMLETYNHVVINYTRGKFTTDCNDCWILLNHKYEKQTCWKSFVHFKLVSNGRMTTVEANLWFGWNDFTGSCIWQKLLQRVTRRFSRTELNSSNDILQLFGLKKLWQSLH